MLFIASVFVRTADARSAEIEVSNVWSRPASVTAVVYATFQNHANVADRLLGATSPVARRVEIHQTFASKPAAAMPMSMGTMPMLGSSMTSMKSVTSIPIPAMGQTSLSPGGYHLMLDLRRPIRSGELVGLRLHFARAGWVTANARVRPIR